MRSELELKAVVEGCGNSSPHIFPILLCEAVEVSKIMSLSLLEGNNGSWMFLVYVLMGGKATQCQTEMWALPDQRTDWL